MADEIQNSGPNFAIVTRIIEQLEPLNTADREHVLRTVATWLRVGSFSVGESHTQLSVRPSSPPEDEKFSNRSVLSVKDFIFEKDPVTETERMACLAYYLTHYMETPHFKTADLTHLNTEAAQRSFSNPAVASGNANRDGFFVSAPKAGYKQLSAMGERFVHALPNREAAAQIKKRMGTRRSKRSGGNQGVAEELESENKKT